MSESMQGISIELIGYPSEKDWEEVKRRALITCWKDAKTPPGSDWKSRILNARHSPIRHLMYSFKITGIPSNISTHFARHKHAEPYVGSLRNDRQSFMNGDSAPRNTPVNMILDVNGEEIMVMANKRLCMQASETTRKCMEIMCALVVGVTPEYAGKLVPLCEYCNGVCHEMKPCGRYPYA